MEKTTIQVNNQTLQRLKSFKAFERQSYDDILNVFMDDAEQEVLSVEEVEEIKLALENVRKGKVKPIEQVAKELKIVLK
jgi:hypothetical protein